MDILMDIRQLAKCGFSCRWVLERALGINNNQPGFISVFPVFSQAQVEIKAASRYSSYETA